MPDEPEVSVWLDPAFEPGLLSVVIPTYNRAALLLETLESVFKQDYRPLEVIVADDGSTDDTLAQVRGLEPPTGVELRVVEGPHKSGTAARNRGASECGGEYVMFLDSDDLLHKGALAALVAGIGEADVVFGRWREWFSHDNPPRFGPEVRRAAGDDLLVELLRNEWLLPSAVLHRRRSLLRVTGWDEKFTSQDDYEFMVRIALAGARAAAVEVLVADYRRHGTGQLSDSKVSQMLAAAEIVSRRVEAALDSQGWTPGRRLALAWRWYWEGRRAWFHMRDAAALKACMAEARRVDPSFRAPRLWYRWLAAVAGYVAAERAAAIGRALAGRK